MKRLIIFGISAVIISCDNLSKTESEENKKEKNIEITCPDTWEEYEPSQDELDFEIKNGIVQERPNDSTIQQIRYGKVWFEMINPTKIDGDASKCYLKNYRTDGTLESEGFGIYYEHPVADYSMDGIWKFYSCDESLKKVVKFKNGERLSN